MQQQTATVMEGARRTPILDAADVVVAGGGIAGCAAALAAARNGAAVLLIEKQTMLGGLAIWRISVVRKRREAAA